MFNRNKQRSTNGKLVHQPVEAQQAVLPSMVNAAGTSQPKRDENSIAILVDEDSGIEYYMETIDIFAVDGRMYVAMFPVPEKKQVKKPQLVLLRIVSGEGQVSQTVYESIRDEVELARVFDAFFSRYETGLLSQQLV